MTFTRHGPPGRCMPLITVWPESTGGFREVTVEMQGHEGANSILATQVVGPDTDPGPVVAALLAVVRRKC